MAKRLIVLLLSLCVAGGIGAPGTSYAIDSDVYIVQPGDSLWKISRKYQVGLTEVIQANPQIKNPDLIYPGDRVTVPLLTAEKQWEAQVVQRVNQERAKYGLRPLTANWELARVARVKSQDMRDRRYFSHQSPTYGSPFEMIRAFGITFVAAGENIAAGQPSPQAVMNSWMNSPGHRQNILNANYTEIGVGYAKGGAYGHYWTQIFIRR